MKQPYILRTLAILLVTVLAIFYFLNKCNCSFGEHETEVRIDTVFVNVKTIDTVYVPKLVKETWYVPKTDTITEYETKIIITKVDTAAILKDYRTIREYSDVQKIQYGTVTIKDRVKENKILSRNLIVNQKLPEITKTVTIKEEKRNQIYGGLNLLSDGKELLPGLSAMFKNKKDKAFEVGAFYGLGNKLWIQAGVKSKISFRK